MPVAPATQKDQQWQTLECISSRLAWATLKPSQTNKQTQFEKSEPVIKERLQQLLEDSLGQWFSICGLQTF